MFLDRPIGILSLIDEECHFPQGSDSSLVTKFTRNFGNCRSRFRSSFYPVPERELPEPSFTISHYAGEITYSVRGFLEKNRDSLPDRVVVVLQSSTHPVVSSLFNASLARTGSLIFNRPSSAAESNAKTPAAGAWVPGESAPPVAAFGRSTRKRLTLGFQFRTSLAALLEKMNHCETHYVRCIKSNPDQKAGKFDSEYVLHQLRNSGVMETVWIRRHGFPYRPTFEEFSRRFRGLFNVAPDGGVSALIDSVLAPYGSHNWYLGRRKVFIKYAVADDLAGRIRLRDVAARRLQKWYCCCLLRRRNAEAKSRAKKKQPGLSGSSQLTTERRKMDDDFESDNYQQNSSPSSHTDSCCDDPDSYEVCQWFKDCVYDQLNPSRLVGRVAEPKWFFENLSRQDSEVLLRNQSVGCFLVRISQSDANVLVLSFRAPERCRHYLIDRVGRDKLGVRGERDLHDDLAGLLDYYRRHPLSNYTGYLSHFYGHQPPNRMKNHSSEYDQLPPNIVRKTRRGMSAPKGQHHVC
ncbi:putative Myosin-IIIb [Hypsibius exemplaris]|uniref:Myosin-IIIb n=1 Tax=Hypsibius exemplaris TaxID=2072580 RepID=A0A9X6RMI6_HYPEX|nr:putative Myosin-IIIb [Hypsibius exemplaris]